jgi:hypothetical protein
MNLKDAVVMVYMPTGESGLPGFSVAGHGES